MEIHQVIADLVYALTTEIDDIKEELHDLKQYVYESEAGIVVEGYARNPYAPDAKNHERCSDYTESCLKVPCADCDLIGTHHDTEE
jgi:hypothetical protein